MGLSWDGGPVTVGRALDCGIVVSHQGVSGRHLRLETDGGQVVATDLGSRNGTRRLGEPLSGPTPLLPGEPLDLAGEVVLRVLRVEAAGATARTVTPTQTVSMGAGPAWRLVVDGAAARPAVRVVSVDGAAACRFRPSHSSTLLAVLAERHQAAFPAPGWVMDDDLRVALWGKAGLVSDPNNLNVVIYRIRQRLAAEGVPASLLTKETNRLRLAGCDVSFRRATASLEAVAPA